MAWGEVNNTDRSRESLFSAKDVDKYRVKANRRKQPTSAKDNASERCQTCHDGPWSSAGTGCRTKKGSGETLDRKSKSVSISVSSIINSLDKQITGTNTLNLNFRHFQKQVFRLKLTVPAILRRVNHGAGVMGEAYLIHTILLAVDCLHNPARQGGGYSTCSISVMWKLSTTHQWSL